MMRLKGRNSKKCLNYFIKFPSVRELMQQIIKKTHLHNEVNSYISDQELANVDNPENWKLKVRKCVRIGQY